MRKSTSTPEEVNFHPGGSRLPPAVFIRRDPAVARGRRINHIKYGCLSRVTIIPIKYAAELQGTEHPKHDKDEDVGERTAS